MSLIGQLMSFILHSTNKYNTYINSQRGVNVTAWTSDTVYRMPQSMPLLPSHVLITNGTSLLNI